MPGVTSDSGDFNNSLFVVPYSLEAQPPSVYPLRTHRVSPPYARLSISWARGNTLRVSLLQSEENTGGEVVEVKLSNADGAEIPDAQWRRVAYGSVAPFAFLQSRKNSIESLHYEKDWWEHVLEYSKEINSLLGSSKQSVAPTIEDPKMVLKEVEEPTSLKAAWELLELFYADKQSQNWLPERLLDWLADFDRLLSGTQPTVHTKLVAFQKELVTIEAVENDPEYWQVISSALAVGWLDVVVKLLRLHGSYMCDQLGNREIENGLVEAVALLISNMPRLRPDIPTERLGECYNTKPEFMKGLESMYSLAKKCMNLKPSSNRHKLMALIIGILEENTEVVLAECSISFGPWMITHAIELLTAGSTHAEIILHEEQAKLGGICIEELHRLIYAQILSSHSLTWNIAPIYLTSCMKQGLGLLENLLYKQPIQHHQLLLKSIEICRLNGLDYISYDMMKIAGVHYWKHGKKGSAVYWLQQARDEVRLNRIAKHLFEFVGKSVSDESFKQWEGMIELLGNESKTAGGLEFLKKYRDFRRALQQVQEGNTNDGTLKAAEALISLMKNPSTPQQFWLPLLYDSLKLLNWREHPLLDVSQTNLLVNKLQELSLARLLPGFVDSGLPAEALRSVRLALATNLGRAILQE